MSEHLLQQTLSSEMAAMAEYYHQGLEPPTPAESRRGALRDRDNRQPASERGST